MFAEFQIKLSFCFEKRKREQAASVEGEVNGC